MKPQEFKYITIMPKHTMARTQYYDMDAQDENYIYTWLITFLADMTELASHNNDVMKEFFTRKNSQLPRGRQGTNSHASFIAGIISAKMHNVNHNISEPQLSAIEHVFDVLVPYYSDCDSPPQPIRFRIKLFD